MGRKGRKKHNFSHSFVYSKANYTESISLQISEDTFLVDIDLWNSENDDREWIESINGYDDLFHHILCQYKEVISTLLKLHKDLIN